MKIDWSINGHGLPKEALRASDNLKAPGGLKIRAARIAWERTEVVIEEGEAS